VIHIYTGCGKGKTTAALGLALRASGAGLKIFIGQFNKARKCSEHKALEKIPNITIEQYGTPGFVRSAGSADIRKARYGLRRVKQAIASGKFNMIILDEINVAVKLRIFTPEEILSLLDKAPGTIEIVLTGRGAHPALIKRADLVSLIKETKHYYKKGVGARKGIEY
jgi:cob(I)alamin adenosyltransferase